MKKYMSSQFLQFHEIGYKKSEKTSHTEMMTHFSPKVEDRKRIARKEDKKEFQELAGVLVGKTVTSGKISETTSSRIALVWPAIVYNAQTTNKGKDQK